MSEMGRNSKITGILNKSLDTGPLKPVNPGFFDTSLRRGKQKTYYCPDCYSYNLWFSVVETSIYDVVCLNCHTHLTKIIKQR